MNFSEEIKRFVSEQIGGIVIISSASDEIVYADSFLQKKYGEELVGKKAPELLRWLNGCPELPMEGDAIEWESVDMTTRGYYRVNSAMFEKEGATYKIHIMTDVTEYMELSRDIAKYMAFLKKLSAFQTAVLEKLSDTFYELLPMISEYFKTEKVYFLLQKEENIDIITYNRKGKTYCNDRVAFNEKTENVFAMGENEEIVFAQFADEIQEVLSINGENSESRFEMLCSGVASEQKYAIYLGVCAEMNSESMEVSTLSSVIKLFVENGIMKEKLLYESEHDRLSGLYNKGKYLDMMESEYQTLDSIGIFNLDVNNLKTLNDTMGHEAGDKLLIKAANSIRKVTSNKVHGYRMGGDEFLLVACNVTKEELDVLKTRWEKELERLNTLDDGIHCVIAAGVVYGTKGYDFAALMKEADELMYIDKKAKKKPGEEIR